MKSISLVVPVYNEEESLPLFFTRLDDIILKKNDAAKYDFEVLFIDDGSRDASLALIKAQADASDHIKYISFSRNFGKEAALSAGIRHATGDAVIPIDADLQHPLELVWEMLDKWERGADMVVGVRDKRSDEGFLKKKITKGFYKSINKISEIPLIENAGDFRLLDKQVVSVIRELPENNLFMKGLFSWVGFKVDTVHFEDKPRQGGKTTWNYWKLWNFALDGITAFSTVPLRIWTYVGAGVSAIAFLFGLFTLIKTLFFGVDVPGYASLLIVMLFLGGIQLVGIGIIGEYVGRIFNQVKGRPNYIVKYKRGFDD